MFDMRDLDVLGAEEAYGDAMLATWKANEGAATSPVPAAIASGNHDEDHLTDLEFFARHPERNGAKLQKGDTSLAKEWISIRDSVVRPALARTGAPPPPPAAMAPRPVPGSNAAVARQVSADSQKNTFIAAALGGVALLAVGVAWATR